MPAENDDLPLLDFDTTKPVVDLAGIHAVNPHRFGMEMLTAIVRFEPENKLFAVGWLEAEHPYHKGHVLDGFLEAFLHLNEH